MQRHRYWAAAGFVLLAAAALRFHGLTESSLSWDGAAAALNAQGSFEELLRNTRSGNTSPILHPLLLWVIQKVQISAFSVVLPSALGNTLAVGVLLFLLPRCGVPRGAALLAGAMAAVSWGAIYEAQGAREYSFDALFTTLLIVGLLRFVREGRGKALLGGCLLLGPLVQYGLALFGFAVLATACLALRPKDTLGEESRGSASRPWAGLRARAALLAPTALFAAGCAIAGATTLSQQLADRDLRLGIGGARFAIVGGGYYDGELTDLAAVAGFVVSRLRDAALHSVAGPIVLAALVAGVLLVFLRQRNPDESSSPDAPPLRLLLILLAVSLAVAAAFSVSGLYPLGAGVHTSAGRHSVHLGPALFATAGVVLVAANDALATRFRRWPSSVFFAVCVLAIAGTGASAIARRPPFASGTGTEVARILRESAQENDLVYLAYSTRTPLDFHLPDQPAGAVTGTSCSRTSHCIGEIVRLARSEAEPPERIWLTIRAAEAPRVEGAFRFWDDRVRIEPLVTSEYLPQNRGGDLWLMHIPNAAEMLARVEARYRTLLRNVASGAWGEPLRRSRFDLHYREETLFYRRASCSEEDLDAEIFLESRRHSKVSGTPEIEARRFRVRDYGLRLDGECLARVPLPMRGLSSFRTGSPPDGDGPEWTAEIGREDIFRWALSSLNSGRPAAAISRSAAGFDLYRDGADLWYHRAPCAEEQTEARFRLLLHLSDPAFLKGIVNRDFDFDEQGMRLDDSCLAIVPFGAGSGEVVRVVTGQVGSAETAPWSVTFRLDSDRFRVALRAREAGEWGAPDDLGPGFRVELVGTELRYLKTRCAATDTESRFFLHVHPHPALAEPGGRGAAYENRDFDFAEYGLTLGETCLALVPLPLGGAHRISTGQWRTGEPPFWQADLTPGREFDRAALDSLSSGARGRPLARAAFDLYCGDRSLLFHRAACAPDDTEPRFFLHLYPLAAADLPPQRQEYGFENRDFRFSDFGIVLDSECLTRVPIPAYGMSRIRFGQFTSDGTTLWDAEFSPGE